MTTTAKTPQKVFYFRSPRTWVKTLTIWILLGLVYVGVLYLSKYGAGRTAGWYAIRFLAAFVAVAVVDLLITWIGWGVIGAVNKGMIKMTSLGVGEGGVRITDIHGKKWDAGYEDIASVDVEPNPRGKAGVDELCITLKGGAILYTPLHTCGDEVVREAAEELRRRISPQQ